MVCWDSLVLRLIVVAISLQASCAIADTDLLMLNWLRVQAVAFEHAEGVEMNEAKARELYCEAARLGDHDAMYSLDWMYANGRGVVLDDAEAGYLFHTAAETSHAYEKVMVPRLSDVTGVPPKCLVENAADDPAESEAATVREQASLEPPKRVVDLVRRLASECNVDPELVFVVIQVESNIDSRPVSPRNA